MCIATADHSECSLCIDLEDSFVFDGWMAGYNLTRTIDEVLEHFKKDQKNLPSFTVHLHPEYWTLNNGSKFLYNNPVAVGGAHYLTHYHV
jgi:hypothetical protein